MWLIWGDVINIECCGYIGWCSRCVWCTVTWLM